MAKHTTICAGIDISKRKLDVAIDGSSEPIRLTHNKWEDSIPSWGVMPISAAK